MNLSSLLFELPTERLREIVRRRAATLRGVPRIADKRALAAFLADALSQPYSIMEALNSTDLLQLQVLVYIILQDGEVTFDSLVIEAGEAGRENLRQAVNALEGLGLAFWTGRPEPRGVFVPPAVRQQTPLPLPMLYRLPRALKQYDAATVGRIYENLDLPRTEATSKEARIRVIVRELNDPENLRSVVSSLPEAARAVLEFMLRQGGVSALHELAARMETRQRNQLYSYDWFRRWAQGAPRNPVEELLARGLLVLEGSVGWGYGHILIPGDVLNTLIGRTFFPDGARGLPDWDLQPAGNTAALRHETLCRDIAYLLGYLGRAEAARTGKGTIHRTVLKALARGLTIPSPEYAGFVYALAREAELIAPQGRNNLYDTTNQGLAWLDLAPEAQLHTLYEVWRAQVTWAESLEDPLADGQSRYRTENVHALRDSILTLLSDLARERPGELASLESVTARAQYRWWSLFPNRTENLQAEMDREVTEPGETAEAGNPAREVVTRVAAGSLFYLGLTEVRRDESGHVTQVALSPRGRRRFVQEQTEPGTAAPEAATRFIVQPNMEIFAPPDLAPRLLYRLFRIAEPTSGGMLALSRETLRRAFDRGETAKGVLQFFREHSQTGLPQNVEYLLKEVGQRHGHIRIGQAGLYLQVDDPMLLKELKAQKKLNIRFRAQLADTVALITGDSVEAVLRQLRQAGYFPVSAEETAASGPATSSRARRAYQPPAHATRPTSDDVETRIDWTAIAAEDGLPWDAAPRSVVVTNEGLDLDHIRRLMEQAIRDRACVAIAYEPVAHQPADERVIEPRSLNGLMLRAYCRSRLSNTMLNIRYICRAHLTGETF